MLMTEVVEDEGIYASGKYKNDWYIIPAYDALLKAKQGYTARQLVILIQQQTDIIITEKTAGVVLNTIRKGIQGHPAMKCKVFKHKKGKTYEYVYRIIHH